MKKLLLPILAALLLLLSLAGVAAAQSKGAAELGYDLGLSVVMPDDADDDWLMFGVPSPNSVPGAFLQTLRCGFYLDDHSELEPTFGLFLISVDDESLLQTNLGLSYLYNFSGAGTRPFVKVGGRFFLLDTDEDSATQLGLGAGVGAKSTVGDRLAVRYEGGVSRHFETDEIRGHWDLGLSLGISFFTK